MSSLLVLYHDDPDGWTCGYLINRALEEHRWEIAYPNAYDFETVKFQCVDYDMKDDVLKMLKETKHKWVVMCDFAYQPVAKMLKAVAENKNIERFIWIDHHKTNIEEFQYVVNDYINNPKFEFVLKEGKGACWLVYKRYFADEAETSPIWSINAIASYDVWIIFGSKHQLHLIYYMLAHRNELVQPNHDLWQSIMTTNPSEAETSEVFEEGRHVYNYAMQSALKSIVKNKFVRQIEKYNALCVVSDSITSSLPFEEYDKGKKYDMYCVLKYHNGQWTVSLYSTKKKVDVGKIAAKYGGGGHKNAAGFQMSTSELIKLFQL